MTLQEIAINAAYELSRRIHRATSAEERLGLMDRRTSVQERFRIVYIPSRHRWISADDAVETISGDMIHLDDSFSCEACEGCEHNNDAATAYGRRGQSLTICSSCVDDTWYCENCESRYTESVSSYEGRSGDTLCASCYEEQEEEQEEEQVRTAGLCSYHGAERWSRPSSIPYLFPAFSLEWEMEVENRQGALDALRKANLPMVSWERDGSLNESKGFELLVQWSPDVDDLHKRCCEIASILKPYSPQCWDNGRCGIHMNVCRNGWTRKQVMRLLYMVYRNKAVIESIAGRSNTHWATFPEARKNLLKAWANGMLGKYCVIRCGDDRLEWRIFRSTIRMDRLRMYLLTIDKLGELAKSKTPAVQLVHKSAVILEDVLETFLAARRSGKGGK